MLEIVQILNRLSKETARFAAKAAASARLTMIEGRHLRQLLML